MGYVYLLLAICFSAAIAIFAGFYNKKNKESKNANGIYNILLSASATLTWLIIFLFDFSFDVGVLFYSVLYGVGYACFMVGMINAVKYGPVSLTSFMKQLSFVVVCIWFLIVKRRLPSTYEVLGIVLVVVALYFCLNSDKDKKQKVSLKWLLYVAMVFVGNAFCSIVQKYEKAAFDNQHGSLMMVFGVLFAFIFGLILYNKGDKSEWKQIAKKTGVFPVLAGMSSGLANLFILLLMTTTLSESLIYPGLAIGGLMVTTLFSVIGFKEKLRFSQWIGLIVGGVALVFLNL